MLSSVGLSFILRGVFVDCFEIVKHVVEERRMPFSKAMMPKKCPTEFMERMNAAGKSLGIDRTEKSLSKAFLFSTAIWYACTRDAPFDPLMHSALTYFADRLRLPELCLKAYEVNRPVEDIRVRIVNGENVQTHPFYYGPKEDPIVLEPKFTWHASLKGGRTKTGFWLTYLKGPCKHPQISVPEFLRPYQRGPYLSTVATLYCRYGAILKAPTGFGKTVVASAIIDELLRKGVVDTVTVLVPLRVLVEQWEKALKRFCRECELDLNVRVATYQQIYLLLKKAKDKVKVTRQASSFLLADPLEEPKEDKRVITPDFETMDHYLESNLVVFDEVHTVRATTFAYVLDANKKALRLGLSATPEWLEKDYHIFPLTLLLGPIVEGPDPRKLIEMGKLAKFTVQWINIPSVGCKGLPPSSCLNEKKEEVARLIAAALRKERPWTENDKVLILVPTVGFGKELSKALGGVPVYFSKNKKKLMEEFKPAIRGIAIATSQLLQMGYDDPNLTVLVVADPVSRIERMKQMLGRLLRKPDNSMIVKKVVDICMEDYEKGCKNREWVYKQLLS